MIPLAPARLRRLAREFRAADCALAAFQGDEDDPLVGPPLCAALAGEINATMTTDEVTKLGSAALEQSMRAPQNTTEMAWAHAALAFSRAVAAEREGPLMRMFVDACGRAGVNVFGSGVIGLQRLVASFILGETLDGRAVPGTELAR